MKDDIYALLTNLWSNIIQLLPKLIISIVVILLGYLLARLVRRLVRRFILSLDENLNQRLGVKMLNVDLRSSATFISATFFWIIIALTILICIQILKLEFLNVLLNNVISYLPNILAAVIIVFVGIISSRVLGDLIKSATSSTGLTNGKYLGRVAKYLVLFVSAIIAVGQLGIDIDFLTNLFIIILASLLFGASLSFGLGAKVSVSNILGSYYVRMSHQPGNRVKIDNLEGTITKITDHSVFITTETGTTIIPANEFSNTRVTIIHEKNEK